MFDQDKFDRELNQLIRERKLTEAENRLLTTYAQLKNANDTGHLEYLVGRLAQFYSMPMIEDRVKAERYFMEHEALSASAYARLQTATFYFYTLNDFQKTIRKVDEIKMLKDVSASPSYYSALTLKGQALINLGLIDDAKSALEEILVMIKSNSPKFPFGDELNFLTAAVSHTALMPISREILRRATPNMRSQEYADRAKVLLESLEESMGTA